MSFSNIDTLAELHRQHHQELLKEAELFRLLQEQQEETGDPADSTLPEKLAYERVSWTTRILAAFSH